MKRLEQVRASIQRRYSREKNWRKVASFYGINVGMAWRIAHGYEPKEAHIRHILDLPALVPAPVCPKCGQVHVTKRCTAARPHYRSLFAMPARALRQAMERREEI